jgi:hypothetical protein
MLRAAALACLGAAASASSAATPLQSLIDAALAAGAASLVLPPAATYAQCAAPLVVADAADFLLDFNGARVVFAPGAGVVVERAARVELRNATVVYDPPCFSQGALTAVNESARPRTFDVRVDAGYAAPDVTATPWFATVETKLQFYDPATRERVRPQSGSCIVVPAGPLGGGVWRLRESFNCGALPPLGTLVTVSPRVNGLDFQIPCVSAAREEAAPPSAARARALTLSSPPPSRALSGVVTLGAHTGFSTRRASQLAPLLSSARAILPSRRAAARAATCTTASCSRATGAI